MIEEKRMKNKEPEREERKRSRKESKREMKTWRERSPHELTRSHNWTPSNAEKIIIPKKRISLLATLVEYVSAVKQNIRYTSYILQYLTYLTVSGVLISRCLWGDKSFLWCIKKVDFFVCMFQKCMFKKTYGCWKATHPDVIIQTEKIHRRTHSWTHTHTHEYTLTHRHTHTHTLIHTYSHPVSQHINL